MPVILRLPTRLRWIATSVVLLGTAVAVAACNGDDGAGGGETPAADETPAGMETPAPGGETAPSLEEYFSEIQAISDDANAGRAALSSEFQTARDPGASEEQSAAAAQRLFEGLAMVASEARDRLRGIDPPAAAKDAHDELALATAAIEEECQDTADRAAEVESRSDILELAVECESVEAFSQYRVPCRALEEIADDNGIQVNLTCPLEMGLGLGPTDAYPVQSPSARPPSAYTP